MQTPILLISSRASLVSDDAVKKLEAAEKRIQKMEAKLQRFFEIQKEGAEKNLKELNHK